MHERERATIAAGVRALATSNERVEQLNTRIAAPETQVREKDAEIERLKGEVRYLECCGGGEKRDIAKARDKAEAQLAATPSCDEVKKAVRRSCSVCKVWRGSMCHSCTDSLAAIRQTFADKAKQPDAGGGS